MAEIRKFLDPTGLSLLWTKVTNELDKKADETSLPTKVSDLQNDAGYLTQETDPTVPSWAKAQTKPSYTAQEVGALPENTFIPSNVSDLTNDTGFITSAALPTNVSELTNDAGYLTEHQDISGKANSADLATVATSGSYNDLSNKPFIPSAVSDLTDDSGHYIKPVGGIPAADLAEIYLTEHQDISGKVDKVTGKGLSTNDFTDAYKTKLDNALTEHQDISGKANSADLATVATSGSYNDLLNKPTIPDIQIDGNSIVENGVANIPIASDETPGVVIVDAGKGIAMNSANKIGLLPAPSVYIKAGEHQYTPITPKRQHEAVFYGLAKVAGVDEKNSTEALGTYSTTAQTAIRSMIGAAAASDIPTVPTNVSTFTNDAGYLTEHQDISGKANVADLAAVATSGSYNDLEDRPTIPDIQINGTSIIENEIANIPLAINGTIGVIKVDPAGATGITTNAASGNNYGKLTIVSALSDEIKAETSRYKPIVPKSQHEATFYGLSKAAGADLANEENITVGTYPAAAKTAIQNMLDVPSNAAITTAIGNAIGNIHQFSIQVVQSLPTQNIKEHTIYFVPKTGETNDVYDEYIYVNNGWEMIGNTQIDLSNYVQKDWYADTTKAGLVKIVSSSGFVTSADGSLFIAGATENIIKPGTNVRNPITPKYQHTSTFYGLAKAAGDTTQSQSDNAVGTYTTEAKTAIQQMLGVPSTSDIPDTSIYATKDEIPVMFGDGVGSVQIKSNHFGYIPSKAIGQGSFAHGISGIAIGEYSHSEGGMNHAIGYMSHADGIYTNALGYYSYTQGIGSINSACNITDTAISTQYIICPNSSTITLDLTLYILNTLITVDRSNFAVVTQVEKIENENEYLITVSNNIGSGYNKTRCTMYFSYAKGESSRAEGSNVVAYANYQYARGKNNSIDILDNYIEIIGNGNNATTRSNAYALDWEGNGHYMGNIYVGANTDSTGGIRVATIAEVATKLDAAEAGLEVVKLI